MKWGGLRKSALKTAAVVTIGMWMLTAPLAFASSAGAKLASGPSFGALVGPLLIVVLFALAAFWVRRWTARRGGSASKGRIEILAARQVAPHRFVQVIQVAGKSYLIGIGENIELLSELPVTPDELQTVVRRPTYPDFMQLLSEYSKRIGRARQSSGEDKEEKA